LFSAKSDAEFLGVLRVRKAEDDPPLVLVEDASKFTGKSMMAYGQTAITEDLYAARDAAGGQIIDEAVAYLGAKVPTDRACQRHPDCCQDVPGFAKHPLDGEDLESG
jgi:hypothetical protein